MLLESISTLRDVLIWGYKWTSTGYCYKDSFSLVIIFINSHDTQGNSVTGIAHDLLEFTVLLFIFPNESIGLGGGNADGDCDRRTKERITINDSQM